MITLIGASHFQPEHCDSCVFSLVCLGVQCISDSPIFLLRMMRHLHQSEAQAFEKRALACVGGLSVLGRAYARRLCSLLQSRDCHWGFHSCVTARLCSCLFDLQGIIQQSVSLWSDSSAYVVPSLPFQASKTQNPVSTSVPGLQSPAIGEHKACDQVRKGL